MFNETQPKIVRVMYEKKSILSMWSIALFVDNTTTQESEKSKTKGK